MSAQTPLLIDSHAHLTMFEPDEVPAVLQRAADFGVAGILVPATNRDDLDRTIALATEHPRQVVAAAGLHPHDATSLDGGLKRALERAISREQVVAVGEIGLDYHYMNSPREDQLRALRWQLGLAIAHELPVVLHNRSSWQDLEAVLREQSGRLRGVCHSFTEAAEQARVVLELGLLVGISGMITFKQGGNIREMAASLSLGSVLVETDSPFLAPVPHRGKQNEPAYVVYVAERLASVLEVNPADLMTETTASFRELFDPPSCWASWPLPISY
jgi:TatD DNase family protein